jgi:hypothetical protein
VNPSAMWKNFSNFLLGFAVSYLAEVNLPFSHGRCSFN